MLEGDDSGYPYPVASKVVEGVLTELRIPQAIEENRQAIEALEPAAALTFDEIWNMGFITGDWVEGKEYMTTSGAQNYIDSLDLATTPWVLGLGYLTESEIQAMIGPTGAILTFEDIWAMGFITGDWVNDNFINKNVLIADYVRKSQLGITPVTLPHATATNTKPLWEHLVSVDTDGQTYASNLVVNNIIQNHLPGKLNISDFNAFLKTGVTPEFMDLVAGSLMDVDVKGLKTNLNVALANRPTFGEIPSVLLTLGSGRKDDIEGFLNSYDNWILGIFNLSDPFKNQVLVQTLGVGGSRIKQFDTCFRGTGSGLEGLTTSLRDEADKVSAEFGAIETDMGKVRDDFEMLRGEIQHFLNIFGTPSADSGFAMIKNLMGEFRNFIEGSAVVGGFNGVRDTFGDATIRFKISKEALTRLKAKADLLKTCGAANLQW